MPATFALLIDSSQSMSRRFDFVKDAATRLTAFLRPKDTVVVAPFAKRLAALTGPTGDRRTIIEAIQHIEPTGGTAILDALIELSERLPKAEDRRSVILISDGYDEHSHASFEEALAAVKSAGITIYVVGIGGVAGISLKGERELKRLATDTGGRVFFPPRPEELAGVYDQLAADAQNRYLVTYTPEQHRARRKLACRESEHPVGSVRGADTGRLSRAEAAAHPADARVHGHRSLGPVRGDQRR